ncbi:hypothetical protein Cpir12675_006513 [Ceratocystis pirilliformis]|uniref:Oxidoreductase n=1 Tax=Ceratocystis pirilliformis TaxID=259994 RepID=A0ABR3YI57_9PEZI
MPAAAVFRAGSTGLITGAASGIGLALARFCAAQGMSLVLADKNIAPLSSFAAEYPASTIHAVTCDVSLPASWTELCESTKTVFGSDRGIELLALNAATCGSRENLWADSGAFRHTFNTNVFGVVHGIETFLPLVRKAASTGHRPTAIVITGSKQGITNPPGNPAYNASKAAVKSIAEQLSFDLQNEPTGVHLLVPGWTFTGMTGANVSTEKPPGAWLPEQVIEYLDRKMAESKFYIICPDNEVDETTDKKRMTWAMGDIINDRQPLSRWREDTKAEAAKSNEKMTV